MKKLLAAVLLSITITSCAGLMQTVNTGTQKVDEVLSLSVIKDPQTAIRGLNALMILRNRWRDSLADNYVEKQRMFDMESPEFQKVKFQVAQFNNFDQVFTGLWRDATKAAWEWKLLGDRSKFDDLYKKVIIQFIAMQVHKEDV